MVEECNEAFLKFDLDYDQVCGVQTKSMLPLFLSADFIVRFVIFLFNASYCDLAARCPWDGNCKGCNSGHSDNTLYTFGYVRRPEELRKARCWLVQPNYPAILSGTGTCFTLLINTAPDPTRTLKDIHCRWGSACRRVETGMYPVVCAKESIASITYTQKSD